MLDFVNNIAMILINIKKETYFYLERNQHSCLFFQNYSQFYCVMHRDWDYFPVSDLNFPLAASLHPYLPFHPYYPFNLPLLPCPSLLVRIDLHHLATGNPFGRRPFQIL